MVGSDFAMTHGVIVAFSTNDADWEDRGSFQTVVRRYNDALPTKQFEG
jgi:hypothetical protein